jgi:type II restriction enzyme
LSLSSEQIETVENVLRVSLKKKLDNYHPEPNSMPFHTRLLGADRLALFSFIQSLNTNFGTTIFEPVAVAVSSAKFAHASKQTTAGELISEAAQAEIQRIMDGLIPATKEPDKINEIERLRLVCRSGKMVNVILTKVDLAVESFTGERFLFDIKTAKPNAGMFKEFKRTLLEWVAVVLAQNPAAEINTAIAIPYNPYAPKPYSRWTIRGMLDLKHELFVAEEFWDFLGGEGTYETLLDIFERIGIELRPDMDKAFQRFK